MDNPFDNTDDAFEKWWEREGKKIDPDTEDVSWFDKRKGLAGAAFAAAMAHSRNYVANREIVPDEMAFANGRQVWIRYDDEDEPYLFTESCP